MSLYGQTFASKLLERDDYEGAIREATKAMGAEDDNPEHYFDRATAYAFLERFDEAVSDYVRAKELDAAEQVLDDDALDDGHFSALLGSARARATKDVAAGCARLDEYRATWPKGRHLHDLADWQKRLRGELQSHFVKERLS